VELIPPLSNTSSWRGALLNEGNSKLQNLLCIVRFQNYQHISISCWRVNKVLVSNADKIKSTRIKSGNLKDNGIGSHPLV
jgi:hypothetical protein